MTRMTTLHGIPPLMIIVMLNGAPMEHGGGQNVHRHIQNEVFSLNTSFWGNRARTVVIITSECKHSVNELSF